MNNKGIDGEFFSLNRENTHQNPCTQRIPCLKYLPSGATLARLLLHLRKENHIISLFVQRIDQCLRALTHLFRKVFAR